MISDKEGKKIKTGKATNHESFKTIRKTIYYTPKVFNLMAKYKLLTFIIAYILTSVIVTTVYLFLNIINKIF